MSLVGVNPSITFYEVFMLLLFRTLQKIHESIEIEISFQLKILLSYLNRTIFLTGRLQVNIWRKTNLKSVLFTRIFVESKQKKSIVSSTPSGDENCFVISTPFNELGQNSDFNFQLISTPFDDSCWFCHPRHLLHVNEEKKCKNEEEENWRWGSKNPFVLALSCCKKKCNWK
jgi:hypothetical protein